LPTSGSMLSGTLYARTRLTLRTSANGSSSSRQLPTPRARDWKGQGYEDGLPSVVALLPTPRTSDGKGAGVHGEGGPDLRTAVSLLPTPAAADADRSSPTYARGNPTLKGAALSLTAPPADAPSPSTTAEDSALAATDAPTPTWAVLLPTPTASSPGSTANYRPDGTPYSEGYGPTLLDAVRLLPTPRATDGEKGGPNQRGSKGDLTLPSAAHRIGASTPRPSRGGKRRPAAVPPGQLTIEVG
jgi:hypothetical protein